MMTNYGHNNSTYLLNTTIAPEQDILIWPVWSAILLSVITLTGVIGNIFIIGAVCISDRLKAKANAFMVNLAVADLIVCAYVMPMGIATSQAKIERFEGILCDFNAFITLTTCGVSTQTLMLIAVERYFHICRLVLHDKLFTPFSTGVYIFITWVYTIIWTCQGWTGWTKYTSGASSHICLTSARDSMSYNICLAFFGMILPMIVITICYTRIFKKVKSSKKAMNQHQTPHKSIKSNKGNRQNRREKQLIFTLLAIVIIFVICWLPVSLVLIIASFSRVPRGLFIFVIWLAMCNSVVNSFVYGIMNKNFRKGYKLFFSHIFFCVFIQKEDYCKCKQTPSTSSGGDDDNSSEKSSDRHSTGCETYLSNLSLPQGTGSQNNLNSTKTDDVTYKSEVLENNNIKQDSIGCNIKDVTM